eukprot:8759947-Lingulodinium_polyedra.AAC.1
MSRVLPNAASKRPRNTTGIPLQWGLRGAPGAPPCNPARPLLRSSGTLPRTLCLCLWQCWGGRPETGGERT